MTPRLPSAASLGLVAVALCWGCATTTDLPGETVSAVRALLDKQTEAWNRGDLSAFARGYWDSDNVVYASAERVTVGLDAMLDRYRRRYPDTHAMGRLVFDRLELGSLGSAHVLAAGRWTITRDDGELLTGRYALVLRRFPYGWRIVVDYTTVESELPPLQDVAEPGQLPDARAEGEG